VVFHPEAVWNKDCEATFYLSRAATRDGSTLLASKTTGKLDREHPITVRCIDFGAWVKRSFTKDDFVIVKLDIEGAEYAVLRKMIDDGSIELVDRLYVEFHADRIGLRKDVHNQLVAELARRGLQIRAWDALGH
jgi:FkbM family methyltransferase